MQSELINLSEPMRQKTNHAVVEARKAAIISWDDAAQKIEMQNGFGRLPQTSSVSGGDMESGSPRFEANHHRVWLQEVQHEVCKTEAPTSCKLQHTSRWQVERSMSKPSS